MSDSFFEVCLLVWLCGWVSGEWIGKERVKMFECIENFVFVFLREL